MTDPIVVRQAVTEAEDRFGRVDVLVNDVGYGYLAAIEEGDDADIRALRGFRSLGEYPPLIRLLANGWSTPN